MQPNQLQPKLGLFIDTPDSSIPEKFTTPKKRPTYDDRAEEQTTTRKIKSITKFTEKECSSTGWTVLLVGWMILAVVVVSLSFIAKVNTIEIESLNQIKTCQFEFEVNNCVNPVKGAVEHCLKQKFCMSENAESLIRRNINYSKIAGSIISDFNSGLGYFNLLIGFLLLWVTIKSKGKQKSVITMEFYQH